MIEVRISLAYDVEDFLNRVYPFSYQIQAYTEAPLSVDYSLLKIENALLNIRWQGGLIGSYQVPLSTNYNVGATATTLTHIVRKDEND